MKYRNVNFKAIELSDRVKGSVTGVQGLSVTGISTLESPLPNTLLFVRGSSGSAIKALIEKHTQLCILLDQKSAECNHQYLNVDNSHALIVVDDPYAALLDLVSLFYEPSVTPKGIDESARIHSSARIGENVSIGALCVVGPGVVIGDNSTIFPHVSIYENVTIGARAVLHSGVVVREECIIGNDCTVHNNSVIGADGFGYVPDRNVGLRKVPQVGRVVIGDRVEVGANTCIDRGAFGDTTIGAGTKIDNLVQVGHNVTVGKNSILCGKVGIGGSVSIGDGVVVGGHVGVADHVTIASGVRIGGKSGVTRSLTEPGDYIGFPAIPAQQWRRAMAGLIRGTRQQQKKKS